jgi:hypothetical protein
LIVVCIGHRDRLHADGELVDQHLKTVPPILEAEPRWPCLHRDGPRDPVGQPGEHLLEIVTDATR